MKKIMTKLKRFNRSNKQLVNLAVIGIFMILTTLSSDAFVQHQVKRMSDSMYSAMDSSQDQLMEQQRLLQYKQDSLYNEIDKLKAGISDVASRRYKITNAVTIIKGYQRKMGDAEAMKIANVIYDEAERNGIEYSLAMAIVATESRFNPSVGISSAGAKGLCQMMPQTFMYVSKANGYNYSESDVNDLTKNVKIGMIYLGDLQKRYKNLDLVAAGYNGGPRVAENVRKYNDGDTTVYVPAETKKYMVSVREFVADYRKTFGEN